MYERKQAIDSAAQPLLHPPKDAPAKTGISAAFQRLRQCWICQHTWTGKDESRFGIADVVPDEAFERNTVAVGEDAHRLLHHANCLVHDDGLPIAAVLVPAVLHG